MAVWAVSREIENNLHRISSTPHNAEGSWPLRHRVIVPYDPTPRRALRLRRLFAHSAAHGKATHVIATRGTFKRPTHTPLLFCRMVVTHSTMDNSCRAWVNASELQRPYHCASLTSWWEGACNKKYGYSSQIAHVEHGLRLSSCSGSGSGINATRILELLENRTVAILGQSLSANLWCSVVCHLVWSGATLDEKTVASAGNIRVARIRSAAGSSDWVLPPAPHLPSTEHLSHLVEHATGGHGKVFVLLGCRGEYFHRSKLLEVAQGLILGSRAPMERLHSWHRAGHHHFLQAICNKSASNCGIDTVAAIESKYEASCGAHAQLLRRLNVGPLVTLSLGMLLESPPFHFPDLPELLDPAELRDDRAEGGEAARSMAELGLDEPGSYERFYLSALSWVHQRVRHAMNGTSLVLDAMQISRPVMSSYAPRSGHMDPAYVIGFEQSDEARQCRRSHADLAVREECYLRALLEIPSPTDRRLHFRLRHCQPIDSGVQAAAALHWRQRVEAQVGQTHQVPVLRRHRMRIPRWDLHRGLSSNYSSPLATFDCLHSVRSDGAFDVEMFALQEALEARFGTGSGGTSVAEG